MAKLPFNSTTTVGELLKAGRELLVATSESAKLDSEVLLGHALSMNRTALLTRLADTCSEEQRAAFSAYVQRRAQGEPVAYIVGEREFFGLSFLVTPAVLIPRPETELLVEQTLRFLRGKTEARVLDLGTGSGCIGLSIARELIAHGVVDVCVDAVDRSKDALQIAAQNAERLGVSHVVRCIESDWCANRGMLAPLYDIIVANPPYIDPIESTPIELSFEPTEALFSPEAGLRDVRRILQEATPLLRSPGCMMIEVGAGKRKFLNEVVAPYATDWNVLYLGDDSSDDRFTVVCLEK